MDSTAGLHPPERVIILGGGCGGIAAAFWLTSTQQLRDRFKVTVYTRGWRLGGKGASGRDADNGQRIEEHGLHLWLGFYQNAFRTIRAAFNEWQPDAVSPIQAWTDAFTAIRDVTLQENDGPGDPPAWQPWTFSFPPLPGTPGTLVRRSLARRVYQFSYRLQRFLQVFVAPHIDIGDYRGALAHLRRSARRPESNFERDSALKQLTEVARRLNAAVERASRSPRSTDRDHATLDASIAADLFSDLRRVAVLASLGTAVAIGYARDILSAPSHDDHQAGYDAINEQDFRDWLRSCLATEDAVGSAPIRALYDLAFAYPQGDASSIDKGAFAAGVALRLTEEFGTGYQDAPLYKMNAGMGDAIFVPFYEVLVARGVEFKFFHQVTDIGPSADGTTIERITLQRQADVTVPPYRPFVTVQGLKCWPNRPLWGQITGGDALAASNTNLESVWDHTAFGDPTTLSVGADFDSIVLAIPPEMLKAITTQLAAQKPEWAHMLNASASVATQALQLWLSVPSSSLGCAFPPPPLTGNIEPFDTWCDMSHLLSREVWPPSDPPEAIEYFCGPMATALVAPTAPDPIPALTQQVTMTANQWLSAAIGQIWPNVADTPGPLDPGVVVSTYVRANVDPSELYVQVPPTSVKFRLAPDHGLYGNLTLAGDWTKAPFSGGCVENAILSGMIAAQAISGVAMPIG